VTDPAADALADALAAAIEHYRHGALDLAERSFAEAVCLDPRSPRARNGLGVVVAAQGRVAEAIEHFRGAFELDPSAIPAGTNLADAALNLGRLTEARTVLDALIPLAPDDPGPRALMAETLAALGRPRDALGHAARWAALAPGEAIAHRAHGTLASKVGEFAAALEAFRRARLLDAGTPDERLDLQGIAGCLEPARFDGPDPNAQRELVQCLHAEGIESQTLARAAGDLLRAKYGLGAATDPGKLDAWAGRGWPSDALLLTLLERTINVDPRIEQVLVAQRRALLDAHIATGRLPASWRRAAAAMASQCFLNEHAWPIEPAEKTKAAALAQHLEGIAGATVEDAERTQDLLIVVGSFRPLATLANAPLLAQATRWPEALGPLVVRAIREPLAEHELAAGIPRAPIVDAVSNAVRAQYEESPYPRWVDLPEPNPEPIVQQLADQFPAFRPTPALEPPHRILVAGCGSGRHPLRVARGDPRSRILAIDLSVASLAYALRRAREIGVDNVEFRQLDILDARSLEGDFGIIESSGVVHHMRDPAAGLAALAAKLRPGGVMKLGLYSRRARPLITLARERIAALGLDASADSMRAFRARILAGEIEGLEALAESSDLYALSACRDLLFHVQEHQFSPPEIGALLDAEGLRFLGFQLPSYDVLERFQARFPAGEQLADLGCWDRFEADHPGTFSNTFQLWCQKPE
jgi:SAM-dependent methyltransferase/Flp pilus assembly protein TadD